MTRNGQLTSWTGLLQTLEARFALTTYEDPTKTLFKLTQRGSINDYPLDFESLASRIISLLAPFLLSCFISGLALEIRPEV